MLLILSLFFQTARCTP